MTPSTWSVLDGARTAVGDCRQVMADLPDASVDAVVTDPPYGLSKEPDVAEVLGHWLAGDDYSHTGGGFMGNSWDSFVPGPAVWRECLRVLKPGGHLLCFAGTRTFDLMGISLRLAGFEIRDTIEWMYGNGFPKGINVGKASKDPRWDGWNSALKPAHEPIIMARKPLAGTVVANVLAHGTGAINIDVSRVGTDSTLRTRTTTDFGLVNDDAWRPTAGTNGSASGRFPANVILSHGEGCGDTCDEHCPVQMLDAQTGTLTSGWTNSDTAPSTGVVYGDDLRDRTGPHYGDGGGASRFFYCAKTSKAERHAGLPEGDANSHPTVKPVALMRYLVQMVTLPGGTVLDPFMGSGSTGVAAVAGRFGFTGIDRDPEYVEIARHRLAHAARTVGSQLPLVG